MSIQYAFRAFNRVLFSLRNMTVLNALYDGTYIVFRRSNENMHFDKRLRLHTRSHRQTTVLLHTILLFEQVAVDVLEWSGLGEEIRFAMEGRLLYTQPSDHNWRRGGRTIKLMPINAIIVTLGKVKYHFCSLLLLLLLLRRCRRRILITM